MVAAQKEEVLCKLHLPVMPSARSSAGESIDMIWPFVLEDTRAGGLRLKPLWLATTRMPWKMRSDPRGKTMYIKACARCFPTPRAGAVQRIAAL